MIFRTTTDESTGAIKSIGLFGKSISELKTSFSSIKENGIINTLFNTSTIDENAVNDYNNSISEAISNGSSFADKQEIMKSAMNNTNKATAQLIRSTKGAVVGTEALTAAQQASTFIARAQTVALKALSMAGNMLFMWGISEVIQLTVKGIQYLTGANERLMKSQQDIIDKANENIQKYDDEISSLEKLQSKLEDSKNSKESLAKIQSELNNAIGFTPGLLNNESGAWNAANQKISDRIARLKELRKEELNRKIVAEKKQFDNAEINNKNGIDRSFDFYLNSKVGYDGDRTLVSIFGKEYLKGLDIDKRNTIKDIYETLKKMVMVKVKNLKPKFLLK